MSATMNTDSSLAPTPRFATASSRSFPPTARFAPPAHVRRWTGRAALTLPLPSLAALRLSFAASAPAAVARG